MEAVAKMDSMSSFVNAVKVTKAADANKKSTCASPILANMEVFASLISILTLVNASLVFKARIARTTLMTVCSDLAKMKELASIISTISFAFANLLLLEKPAKLKWTLAKLPIVPMERHVLLLPISRTTFVLVPWASKVAFATKTLTNVP